MVLPRCGVLLLAATILISADDLTIKVEVQNVPVDVFVTDRKGHHVHRLTKEQFAVLEDGIPQGIYFAAISPLPPLQQIHLR